MAKTAVANWFGPGFEALHPLLQALHREGGRLTGEIQIDANWIGKLLAKRMGIPVGRDRCGFAVEISHEDGVLRWERRFDDGRRMLSLFRPVGTWPDGHWRESTGRLEMDLTVEVIEGGWYWRPLRARLGGLPVPLLLFPRVEAYKRIENGGYRFSVSFAIPLIGTVLRYRGLLALERRE